MFQEWFIEHEEVQKIWSCGSTLGQDGPEVGARNERTEAVSESALQQSMAPFDMGAPELGVATVRRSNSLDE